MRWFRHVLLAGIAASVSAAELRFDFNAGAPGYTQVAPQTGYYPKSGFGFIDGTTTNTTRLFTVDAAEGNYDVTIRCGSATNAGSTTIKAEARRLMLERVETKPGEFVTRTFTVNVRKPTIVLLNDREKGPPVTPDWDDLLTFEINGRSPAVAAIDVKPAPDAITLFIAGDSTLTDQRDEPYAGWGQMLPRFFRAGVALSNQAESGLALRSFKSQKRLEKLLSMMKKGDYLFIQFGHNDQKDKSPGAGPFTTYKSNLVQFVEAARGKGGIPVLVTSMERRRFNDQGEPVATLADYAEAVRQVGTAMDVPVIDLNAMSLKFYAALGPEESKKAFVFYPAHTFPGQDKALEDNTHHNAYGAYELARCVVEGIRKIVPALAAHLAADVGPFDPSRPDPPEQFDVPASPVAGVTEKPAGS